MENTEDRTRHGTNLYGERNRLAKLTDAAVIEILSSRGAVKQTELARRYGVSHSVVNKIMGGKSWKHIAR